MFSRDEVNFVRSLLQQLCAASIDSDRDDNEDAEKTKRNHIAGTPLSKLKSVEFEKSFYFLHGSMEHQERLKSFSAFSKAGRAILFSTDVAARGLDLAAVRSVVETKSRLTA